MAQQQGTTLARPNSNGPQSRENLKSDKLKPETPKH
jgi:hypothetical protein